MTTTLNELIPEEDGVRLEFKSQLVVKLLFNPLVAWYTFVNLGFSPIYLVRAKRIAPDKSPDESGLILSYANKEFDANSLRTFLGPYDSTTTSESDWSYAAAMYCKLLEDRSTKYKK